MDPLTTAAKIVYLDYDGVLHDEFVNYHPAHGHFPGASGITLFVWMPILERLLEPHPDVAIVLSTSWSRVRGVEPDYAKAKLSPVLQRRVIGTTYDGDFPRGYFAEMSRGEQIEADVLRRAPRSWFALDDNGFDWPESCRDRLILTDGSRGISDRKIQQAIRSALARM